MKKCLAILLTIAVVFSISACGSTSSEAPASEPAAVTEAEESIIEPVSTQKNIYREGYNNTQSVFGRTCYESYNTSSCNVIAQDQTIFFYDDFNIYAMPIGGSVSDAKRLFNVYDYFIIDTENISVKDFQIIGNDLFYEFYFDDIVGVIGVVLGIDGSGEIVLSDDNGIGDEFERTAAGYTDYIIRTEEDDLVMYYLEDTVTQTSASEYTYETSFLRTVLETNKGFKEENKTLYTVELDKNEYSGSMMSGRDPFKIVAYSDSAALLKYGREDTFIMWDFDTQSYTINPGDFAEYPNRTVYANGDDFYVDDVGTLYKMSPENEYRKEKILSIIPEKNKGGVRYYNLGYLFLEDGKIITTCADEHARDLAIYLWDDGEFSQISPDEVRDFKYIGDGYVYYEYIRSGPELHRVKLDGTGWENITEALN